MEFQLEDPLLRDYSTDPSSLFLIESEHMPYMSNFDRFGDLDVSIRREIISSISQLCAGLDPLVTYLSVNYLDRYLSSQRLPVTDPSNTASFVLSTLHVDGIQRSNPVIGCMQQTKAWVLRLVAMSCVSLAAKMQGLKVSLSDLQDNGGLVFETDTIHRMEVVILGALKWRMRSITPFSFVPLFVSQFKQQDTSSRQALKDRATEIIFMAQSDVRLLWFKPSIIAASALLCASKDLFPVQFSCFRDSVMVGSYVNEDHLEQCYDRMQRASAVGYEMLRDMASRSDTPSNVLDQHFGSTSEGSTSERALKRRKICESGPSSTHQHPI